MHDAIEYCIKHDPNKPEFVNDCIADGTVRAEAVGKYALEHMTEAEQDAIIAKENAYYRENWHKALLSLLGYKNPSVANTENYSLMTLKSDTDQPIFFHVDFMKPGKSTYVIEHVPGEKTAKEAFFEMSPFDEDYIAESPRRKQKPAELYVHHTLTQFRQEDVLFHANPRHYR